MPSYVLRWKARFRSNREHMTIKRKGNHISGLWIYSGEISLRYKKTPELKLVAHGMSNKGWRQLRLDEPTNFPTLFRYHLVILCNNQGYGKTLILNFLTWWSISPVVSVGSPVPHASDSCHHYRTCNTCTFPRSIFMHVRYPTVFIYIVWLFDRLFGIDELY